MSTSVFAFEYRETGVDALALPLASSPDGVEPSNPIVIGVPEDEVERRIRIARDAAIADAEQRVRTETERASQHAQERLAAVLEEFSSERVEYFRRVEGEIVQLALAIARKIIKREAELDPTLLAALVRIALDRMQGGPAARVRVAKADAELWRTCGEENENPSRWETVPDETLAPGDCIVETELGTANFGFEAQLRGVEESFMQLMAHGPHTQSRHAARA